MSGAILLGMVRGDDAPPIFWWLWMGFIATLISVNGLRELRRRREFPRFAERMGMAIWPDDSLPKDLPIYEASFLPITRTRYIARGSVRDVPVLTFEVQKGSGRSVSYFTVLAAKGPGYPFGSETFDPELETERLGEWFLLYRPHKLFSLRARLMPFDEMEAQLRSVRKRENPYSRGLS